MTHATAHFADVLRSAGLEVADRPPLSAEERDRVHREYIEAELRRAARERWDGDCPPEYKHFDIDHPGVGPNRHKVERVLAWRPTSKKGLLLSGPTGRVKTRCMWELLRRLAYDEGRTVTSYHAADFFARMGEFVRYGTDDARGWVNAVAARPIVFIDDFGQEAVLGTREHWAEKWFLQLVNRRLEHGLPLLVTTNLTAKDIAAGGRVDGDPLVRRLIEVCEPIAFE